MQLKKVNCFGERKNVYVCDLGDIVSHSTVGKRGGRDIFRYKNIKRSCTCVTRSNAYDRLHSAKRENPFSILFVQVGTFSSWHKAYMTIDKLIDIVIEHDSNMFVEHVNKIALLNALELWKSHAEKLYNNK